MGLHIGKIKESCLIHQQPDFKKSSVNEIENEKINCIITSDSLIIVNKNLAIIKILHSLLLTNSNLTNKEKLDYCKSERYFMKLYLGEIVKNLKISPDLL
ncbi:MAG: hypothetical protein ACFE8L_13310 [Candidatus Hodarchaeota archaeon]